MKKILKRIGIVLGVLIGLLVIVGAVLYVVGGSKVNATVEVPAESLTVTMDSATVAQGRYVAMTHGCMDCHGANLEGRVFVDAPPFFVVASNLTPAGAGSRYDDADWERAIRHGVRPNGHGLAPMMPAAAYTHLADDETAALIAYLKSLPPVENDLPTTEIRPLGRIIAATGGFYMAHVPVDQPRRRPARRPAHRPRRPAGHRPLRRHRLDARRVRPDDADRRDAQRQGTQSGVYAVGGLQAHDRRRTRSAVHLPLDPVARRSADGFVVAGRVEGFTTFVEKAQPWRPLRLLYNCCGFKNRIDWSRIARSAPLPAPSFRP